MQVNLLYVALIAREIVPADAALFKYYGTFTNTPTAHQCFFREKIQHHFNEIENISLNSAHRLLAPLVDSRRRQ